MPIRTIRPSRILLTPYRQIKQIVAATVDLKAYVLGTDIWFQFGGFFLDGLQTTTIGLETHDISKHLVQILWRGRYFWS